MAHHPRYKVRRRRRHQGKTDFRRRINLLRSGESRAVVRRSQRSITVQLIQYHPKGDRILASAVGFELLKHGWKGSTSNTPAAYLTGYLAGKRALAAGVSSAVLDIGLASPKKGARIFASLKGLMDAGLTIPYSEDVLPSEERIRGEHIGEEIKSQFEAVLSDLKGGK